MSARIIREIAASIELIGREISADALDVFAAELELYPEDLALEAIARTRREVPNRFSLADVLERIRGSHPGTEEAWSMVSPALNDERETVILTPQMHAAMGAALNLKHDPIAARMAFKEVYQKGVSEARIKKEIMPRWTVSLGWDPERRVTVLSEAVKLGRLDHKTMDKLLGGSWNPNLLTHSTTPE
jgi:hypothetical protein